MNIELAMFQLVQEAFELFVKDQDGKRKVDMTAFYNTLPNIRNGTTIYLIRAAMNHLLDTDMLGMNDFQCIISQLTFQQIISSDVYLICVVYLLCV